MSLWVKYTLPRMDLNIMSTGNQRYSVEGEGETTVTFSAGCSVSSSSTSSFGCLSSDAPSSASMAPLSATGSSRAASSTASTVSTGMNLISLRTFSGRSSRSGSLPAGMITVSKPTRAAANTFYFNPPMGNTLPRRVISPVMPIFDLTERPVRRLANAVTMVTPALGPSFGSEPAGMCR